MPPFRPLHDLRPADVERLVDAIERHLSGSEAPTRPPAAEDDRRQATYEAAQRLFVEREERLCEESRVVGPALARLREDLPSVPQTVLLCRAPLGGVAGGRVRIRNASTTEASFVFRPRFAPPARFTPARVTLAPGASAVVDVRVDLAGHTPSAEGREVMLVDVLADGRAALKLWIDLELDQPPEDR